MSEPVFRREGDAFVPTGHARGPWDPGPARRGAGRADRRGDPGGGLPRRPARRRLPRAGADGAADRARARQAGAQLQLAEAELSAEGRWCCARAPCACAAGTSSCRRSPATRAAAGPGHRPPRPVPRRGDHVEGFHLTAMDIRFLGEGGLRRGPARAWFRLTRPLIDADPPSALARTVAAADFGNGISRVVDFDATSSSTRTSRCTCIASRRENGSCSTRAPGSSPTAPAWRTRPSATIAAGSGCPRNRCSLPDVSAVSGRVASRRTRRRRPDQHDTRCRWPER